MQAKQDKNKAGSGVLKSLLATSDMSLVRVFFTALRDFVDEAKATRKQISLVERFFRTSASVLLQNTFDAWAQTVAQSKRIALVAQSKERSKSYSISRNRMLI